MISALIDASPNVTEKEKNLMFALGYPYSEQLEVILQDLKKHKPLSIEKRERLLDVKSKLGKYLQQPYGGDDSYAHVPEALLIGLCTIILDISSRVDIVELAMRRREREPAGQLR